MFNFNRLLKKFKTKLNSIVTFFKNVRRVKAKLCFLYYFTLTALSSMYIVLPQKTIFLYTCVFDKLTFYWVLLDGNVWASMITTTLFNFWNFLSIGPQIESVLFYFFTENRGFRVFNFFIFFVFCWMQCFRWLILSSYYIERRFKRRLKSDSKDLDFDSPVLKDLKETVLNENLFYDKLKELNTLFNYILFWVYGWGFVLYCFSLGNLWAVCSSLYITWIIMRYYERVVFKEQTQFEKFSVLVNKLMLWVIVLLFMNDLIYGYKFSKISVLSWKNRPKIFPLITKLIKWFFIKILCIAAPIRFITLYVILALISIRLVKNFLNGLEKLIQVANANYSYKISFEELIRNIFISLLFFYFFFVIWGWLEILNFDCATPVLREIIKQRHDAALDSQVPPVQMGGLINWLYYKFMVFIGKMEVYPHAPRPDELPPLTNWQSFLLFASRMSYKVLVFSFIINIFFSLFKMFIVFFNKTNPILFKTYFSAAQIFLLLGLLILFVLDFFY